MKRQLLALTAAFATICALSVSAKSIKLERFEVLDHQLDETIFPFNNALISFSNVGKNRVELRIINDICPQIPGQFNCMAMAMPVLDGDFEMIAEPQDPFCGVITSRSVQPVIQNNIAHMIVIRDYSQADKINCLIGDSVNLAIEIQSSIVGTDENYSSHINLKKNVTEIKSNLISYSLNTSQFSGKFFKNNHPDTVVLTIDEDALTARLVMQDNPCGQPGEGGFNVCLAMPRIIFAKTFDLASTPVLMNQPFLQRSQVTQPKSIGR